jgi:hypothetical protein
VWRYSVENNVARDLPNHISSIAMNQFDPDTEKAGLTQTKL